MANYQVIIENIAFKSLKKIPKGYQTKITNVLDMLATNPRPIGCKKLINREGWRIRIGDYRVVYEIKDKILNILVIDIGHRKEIYR